MAQLAVVLLALFAQMERTYTLERAAHARVGGHRQRPPLGSPHRHRRSSTTPATSATPGTRSTKSSPKPESPRTSLYRHLPPREPEPLTLGTTPRRWQDTCWRNRDATSPLQSKDVPLERVVWIDPLVAQGVFWSERHVVALSSTGAKSPCLWTIFHSPSSRR
jgi:hypothetical protein